MDTPLVGNANFTTVLGIRPGPKPALAEKFLVSLTGDDVERRLGEIVLRLHNYGLRVVVSQ